MSVIPIMASVVDYEMLLQSQHVTTCPVIFFLVIKNARGGKLDSDLHIN